jgi:protein-ribulosamine 3-kinase
MRLFGGFGGDFWDEYWKVRPKDEPREEYDDRVELYMLYYQLNHYALFGGGYRDGAVRGMVKLIGKYGRGSS